ncbi:hypothetical protein Gasu2_37940 [Galdieria sulphuraria]|nr:hypothetical protein Gasu2_37940 [Galdieria sulphuraria]
MLSKNNLQKANHFTSSSNLSHETLPSCCQDESEVSENTFSYKKFTFVLFIDEYTSEAIASSLTLKVFDQYGYELSEDTEMKKEKGGSSYERRDKFFTFDLYERTVSVLCKLDSKNCHNRIEDFFVYIEVSATEASKPVFFASCVVFENDYRHEPVLFHVEVPFLTSTESLPLVIGIFRAIMDSTVGHHGSWIYKNERCLFHAYESIIDERMKSDKEELTTPNKDHFVSQKDLLDSYKDVREKIGTKDLIDFFVLPRDEVAQELGICVTLLKKICRKNGIKQWPYRKLKNVDAKLSSLRRLLSTPDLIPKNRKKNFLKITICY